jgi:hypothetical protein
MEAYGRRGQEMTSVGEDLTSGAGTKRLKSDLFKHPK